MAEPVAFWPGLIASTLTALGGSAGVIKIIRALRLRRETRRTESAQEAARVKAIREDNEVFKAEMREGVGKLHYGQQRIDAYIRASVQLDDRPMLDACDEGRVNAVNPAFTRDYGWTLDQVSGLGWINNAIATGSDQRRLHAQWASAVANGDYLQTHATMIHANGHVVGEVEIIAQPRVCTDNTKFGWQIVIRRK